MFIKLTGINAGTITRFNVNQITVYGLTCNKDTYVTTVRESEIFKVKETPEQIDALIKASPTHPEVLSLEDINDGN